MVLEYCRMFASFPLYFMYCWTSHEKFIFVLLVTLYSHCCKLWRVLNYLEIKLFFCISFILFFSMPIIHSQKFWDLFLRYRLTPFCIECFMCQMQSAWNLNSKPVTCRLFWFRAVCYSSISMEWDERIGNLISQWTDTHFI